MKNFLILIAVFLFTCGIANAQTEKGDQNLGLDLGLNYANSKNLSINPYDNSSVAGSTKTTNFNLGPNYSYFIADKVDAGVGLLYNSSVTTNSSANGAVVNGPVREFGNYYGGKLFLRKYFMYKNKIGLRAGGFISYFKEIQKNTYPAPNAIYNYNSNANLYSAGGTLDLVYYPSKKLGVSAMFANLTYGHSKYNNTTQGNSSSDNLSLNFVNDGLTISIFYVFGS